ncbi:MAG: hypothetical protein JNL12_16045 [Planctomycetes bacterium]|nr:hypothetical protein [Planctomycetota bacterium]
MTFSASSLRLLERLARRHGVASPPSPTPNAAPIDLARAGTLVSLDEPAIREALTEAADGAPVDDLPALVAASCGRSWSVALLASAEGAAAALFAAAGAARTGRILVFGDALPGAQAPTCECLPLQGAELALHAAAEAAQAGGTPVALVVVEPFAPAAPSLAAMAHAMGALVAVDASRSAFRAGPQAIDDTWHSADFVVLGPSIAAGLPCHAVVGAREYDELDPVTRSVAAVVLRCLRSVPREVALAATGDEILAAIVVAAKAHDIRLVVNGTPAMPWVSFAGQEDAPPDLIDEHFRRELADAGVRVRGPLLWPADLCREAGARQRCAAAFAHALLRLRVLFVEYNSYLSGGLPWPFPGGDERLRARGLTFYRYPRRAPVDVGPVGAAMRIAFGAGELGAVTSSGFYVPTRLVGDVVLTIRYVLRQWHSGPDSACLGLFLQNEASTARYYAQIASTAAAPELRFAAAGLQGEVVGRRATEGDGWLRLVRSGGEVIAFHRPAGSDGFTELGRCAATGDALVAGCKIWSKVRTSGLVADLFELEIEAALAPEQPELLPARPDPRHERPSG